MLNEKCKPHPSTLAKHWAHTLWSHRLHITEQSEAMFSQAKDILSRIDNTPNRLGFILEASYQLSQKIIDDCLTHPSLDRLHLNLNFLGITASRFNLSDSGIFIYFLAETKDFQWITQITDEPIEALFEKHNINTNHQNFYWCLHSLGPFHQEKAREAQRIGTQNYNTICLKLTQTHWDTWLSFHEMKENEISEYSTPAADLLRETTLHFQLGKTDNACQQARSGKIGLGLLILEHAKKNILNDFIKLHTSDIILDIQQMTSQGHWDESDSIDTLRYKIKQIATHHPYFFKAMSINKDIKQPSDNLFSYSFDAELSYSYEKMLCILLRP